MFIRSPLPFVTEFVDELNNALAQHQPGTRLSKLQCLWVSFCLTGILMTNTVWPSSTEAATRPNKEHHDSLEFPFSHLTLAIGAKNDRNGGDDPLNGREKVPVPADRGNSHPDGSRRW